MPSCNFYLKGLKIFIAKLDVKPLVKSRPITQQIGINFSEKYLRMYSHCQPSHVCTLRWKHRYLRKTFFVLFFVCIVQKRQLVQWPHNSSITTLVIQWPQQQFNDHTSSSMTTTVVYHSWPYVPNISQMFENLKRGRQARTFTKNVPKILDLKQV